MKEKSCTWRSSENDSKTKYKKHIISVIEITETEEETPQINIYLILTRVLSLFADIGDSER